MSTIFSKKMPQKSLTSDNQTSFVLGRRAFFNKTYLSHDTENLSKNLNYPTTYYYKGNNKQSGKPLENNTSDLHIQRLRLTTIGASSTKLKNQNDEILFVKFNSDKNYVNTVLSKVRGRGIA